MREWHSDCVPNKEYDGDLAHCDAPSSHKRELMGWIRRAFGPVSDRTGLLTMTPDGKIVRVERVEA